MQCHFHDIADVLDGTLRDGETYLCNLYAEESDFVRLNRARVRQAGRVEQCTLELGLIRGRTNAWGSVDVTGIMDTDRHRLQQLLGRLRALLPCLPDDPYLHYCTEALSTTHIDDTNLPEPGAIIEDIAAMAAGLDLVGIWASGDIHAGFASSNGQRNWHSSSSCNFDWSVHRDPTSSVKNSTAGSTWDPERFDTQLRQSRSFLDLLARPEKAIGPGRYRAYLAPAALSELLGLLGWGGFGLKSLRTGQSPLLRMREEDTRLSPKVTLVENHQQGFAPCFTSCGFIKPAQVVLIRGGAMDELLAAERSAKEFGVPVNAAEEQPASLELAPGTLAGDEILTTLDCGLYVSNLWYCNYSDRRDCRMTGITRFACFWVENAEIVAPVPAMRFDQSLYRLLGDGLLHLTQERQSFLNPDTYSRRSTLSMRLPGALVEGFTLTL